MTSSAMMAAAETLASVASAGPSSPAKDRLASSSKSQARRSDASEPAPEPKKRTRPVSACEACRAKKVRCLLSPDAPVCQNCLASGKQCLFRVDDLAPALRAARFAHCGPPSANARTIAFKKSSKATPRKSREDTDESSRPKPLKRKRSEAESEASDSKDKDPQPSASSAAKPKAKAVFRSFANPNNLAAPLPVPATPTYIKNPSFTSSTMASPPSKHTHTHSSRIPSSFSSASRRRSESASTHNASTVRDTSTIAHLNHRFSHPAIGDPHGAYVESFVPSHDPSHYGHPVDTTAASGSTPVGGPSFFLQQHSPSNASVFSNRSVRSSTMYAASRPLNPPPLDSFRPRRKSSAASPRRLPNQLVDPMSLEYYGHPSDATTVDRYEAFDRPPLIHRVPSGITAEPPHRDVSAELRNGIEKWQRNGTARLGDEHETTKVQVQVQEEHVAQPRPKIVLPFFRWFGTTANTPGYRKIKVGVLQDSEVPGTDELAPALEANGVAENAASFGLIVRDDDQRHSCTSAKPLEDSIVSPHSAQLASPGTRFENKASSSVTRELFEINRPRYPRKDILEHLVSRFLTHFKPSWCPWIEAEELKNGVENGSMPAILANAVCAVAARFSDRPELRKVPRKSSGDPFSEMAKILIIPLLSFPSIEVIEALILLSYAEFAAGSDSGLWMYVGMALRMAQDLGLQHEASIQSIANDKQQDKARLLFWAVIGLDRITTFGTGRPVSIRESEIDTELPTLSEMSDMKDETVIFGHVVRILMLRGRMGELLNRREREESPISAEEGKRDLTRMWFELAQSYSDLPANLHFNVQTFQKSAAHDQSPGFVYLHVLFQSTIGLLDRPALIKKFTGDSVPLLPSFAPAASAAASRTIADILTLGDAFDDRCIIASPYLDQLVLPAGRSFLAERQAAREALRSLGHGTTPASSRPPSRGAAPNQQHSRTSHLVSTKSYAEINLGACQRILQKLQQYWAGASWPLRALEQEAAGNGDEIDPQASDEDAQSAPIRDIEMVLKWAKSRIRSKKRLERSSHATPKPDTMTLSEPMEGMNGILTSNTGSDEFASTHSGDSPFGLGISAGLTFDIDALMGSWQMDHFDPVSNFHASTSLEHSVTPQAGAQTPYPATATNLAGGQMYLSPGGRKSSLSTPSQPPPPPQAMAASPHRTHSRNTSFYRPPSPSPPQQEQEQEHANPASSNALSAVSANHAATPGLLDTSSLAIAEFFSHDQSIWPLSIQNDDLDQDAVNVIASAMQLPTTASGYLANALL